MPDPRTNKLIAQRLDVDLSRHPNPLRAWRRWFCWLVLAASVLFLVLAYVTQGERIYQARPVSSPHQVVQSDCQACHVEPFQSIRRGMISVASVRQIEKKSCGNCHANQIWDDHPDRAWDGHHLVSPDSQAQLESCFDCHREHLGVTHDIKLCDDAHCVNCHADTTRHLVDADLASFETKIPSFDRHPEFMLGRKTQLPGPKHRLREYVELGADGTWKDSAVINFSHADHLRHSSGISSPPRPDMPPVSCEDCHKLDEQGHYYKPIDYEQSCKKCHSLTFATQLAGVRGPLPHGHLESAVAVVRDRLYEHLKAEQSRTTTDQAIQDETERQLQRIRVDTGYSKQSSGSASQPSQDAWTTISHGCGICHEIKGESKDAEVVKPNIPQRWMPHSWFPHNQHDLIDCKVCHVGVDGSDSRHDILMPSVKVCQNCHGASPESIELMGVSQVSVKGAIQANCVTCHGYHASKPVDSDKNPKSKSSMSEE